MIKYTVHYKRNGKAAHFTHYVSLRNDGRSFLEAAIWQYVNRVSTAKITKITKHTHRYDDLQNIEEKVEGYEEIYSRILQEYRSEKSRLRALENNRRKSYQHRN